MLRSEFDRQHRTAVLENPAGIELEIRTSGGRRQFAVSELVAIEELYTSKYFGLWHIEVLEGWNAASAAAVVNITDGKTIWSQPRRPFAAIICCDSRHVWPSLESTRIPYKMSPGSTRSNPEGLANPEWLPLQLPARPGRYRIYLTTHRVFSQSYNTSTPMGEGLPVSSNVLDLEVR